MKTADIEEHNAQVFGKNSDELSRIFDKGLSSDGGEYWVSADNIIDAFTEAGYVLFKLDKAVLDC